MFNLLGEGSSKRRKAAADDDDSNGGAHYDELQSASKQKRYMQPVDANGTFSMQCSVLLLKLELSLSMMNNLVGLFRQFTLLSHSITSPFLVSDQSSNFKSAVFRHPTARY